MSQSIGSRLDPISFVEGKHKSRQDGGEGYQMMSIRSGFWVFYFVPAVSLSLGQYVRAFLFVLHGPVEIETDVPVGPSIF